MARRWAHNPETWFESTARYQTTEKAMNLSKRLIKALRDIERHEYPTFSAVMDLNEIRI